MEAGDFEPVFNNVASGSELEGEDEDDYEKPVSGRSLAMNEQYIQKSVGQVDSGSKCETEDNDRTEVCSQCK